MVFASECVRQALEAYHISILYRPGEERRLNYRQISCVLHRSWPSYLPLNCPWTSHLSFSVISSCTGTTASGANTITIFNFAPHSYSDLYSPFKLAADGCDVSLRVVQRWPGSSVLCWGAWRTIYCASGVTPVGLEGRRQGKRRFFRRYLVAWDGRMLINEDV